MPAQAAPIMEGRNGVLRVITNDNRKYYVVEDVMELLGVSKPKAYKVIRSLREELIADGKLIHEYPCGRVPKKYFDLRTGND